MPAPAVRVGRAAMIAACGFGTPRPAGTIATRVDHTAVLSCRAGLRTAATGATGVDRTAALAPKASQSFPESKGKIQGLERARPRRLDVTGTGRRGPGRQESQGQQEDDREKASRASEHGVSSSGGRSGEAAMAARRPLSPLWCFKTR